MVSRNPLLLLLGFVSVLVMIIGFSKHQHFINSISYGLVFWWLTPILAVIPCYTPYEIPTPPCANGWDLKRQKCQISCAKKERKNMAIQLLHRAQSEPLGAAPRWFHPLKSLGSSIAFWWNQWHWWTLFFFPKKGQLAKANPLEMGHFMENTETSLN
jgi:hypothetical protein